MIEDSWVLYLLIKSSKIPLSVKSFPILVKPQEPTLKSYTQCLVWYCFNRRLIWQTNSLFMKLLSMINGNMHWELKKKQMQVLTSTLPNLETTTASGLVLKHPCLNTTDWRESNTLDTDVLILLFLVQRSKQQVSTYWEQLFTKIIKTWFIGQSYSFFLTKCP